MDEQTVCESLRGRCKPAPSRPAGMLHGTGHSSRVAQLCGLDTEPVTRCLGQYRAGRGNQSRLEQGEPTAHRATHNYNVRIQDTAQRSDSRSNDRSERLPSPDSTGIALFSQVAHVFRRD